MGFGVGGVDISEDLDLDGWVGILWRSGRDKCIPVLELLLDVDADGVLDDDVVFDGFAIVVYNEAKECKDDGDVLYTSELVLLPFSV